MEQIQHHLVYWHNELLPLIKTRYRVEVIYDGLYRISNLTVKSRMVTYDVKRSFLKFGGKGRPTDCGVDGLLLKLNRYLDHKPKSAK